MHSPDPVIPLPDIQSTEMHIYIHQKAHIRMFSTELFRIAQKQNFLKCPSMVEWINFGCNKMDKLKKKKHKNYLAMRMNKLQIHATI